MALLWRTEEEAHQQWCPHCLVAEVQIVTLECCHSMTGPPIEERQDALVVPVNRFFGSGGPGEINLQDAGQGYANVGCIASLCSQWEVRPGPIPEGQLEPSGRCGIPAQAGRKTF